MNIDRDHKLIIFDTCHDKRAFEWLKANLDATFNKDALHAMLQQITAAFPDYFMRMSNESWMLKIRDVVTRKTQTKKEEMVEMVAKIYASESNRHILADIITDSERGVWMEILANIYISENRMKELTGESPFEEKRQSYYGSASRPVAAMCWFGFMQVGHWYRSASYFFIPDFVRKMFAGVFGMPPAVPTPETAEPGNSAIRLINTESETLALLPVIKNMYLSGKLERGKFKIGAAPVNRATKMLKLTEFDIEDDDKNARNLRASMLLNAYGVYADAAMVRRESKAAQPQDTVKAMVTALAQHVPEMTATVLQFIDKSGLKIYDGSTLRTIWQTVTTLLTADKDCGWITASQLNDALYGMPDLTNAVRVVPFRVLDETSVSNARTLHTLNPANIFREATVPAALGVVAVMVSLGLVEAAYTVPSDTDPSALSGLRRFRLTPLGAYAFKLTKKYTYEPPSEIHLFDLDSERLIIKAEGEVNPYEGMMSEFGREIGGRRYAVSPETFLKGCAIPRDIDKKIASFRQVVCQNPPLVWEDFFSALKARSNCFGRCEDSYVIFDVAPDAYDLHELLVSDSVLTDYVIRAEGYRVLVPERWEGAFRERLRYFGYPL